VTIEEGFRLGYFDRNAIERAVDQTHNGLLPVSVTIKAHGQKFRVMVSKSTDKAKVLAERQERRAQED
jgi:hypothetical protein